MPIGNTPFGHSLNAHKMLLVSKGFWFVSLAMAQLVFVTYLALGYGLAAVNTQFADWNKFNATAYLADDTVGNFIYGLHVLLAIIMIIGGSLQLIPLIRQRFRRFHRINGRVFVTLACTISLAGLYLITFRGTVGNLLLHCLTSFSGIVVLVSSFYAVHAAKNRDLARHQTWAIRLYLAANGVLFFRLIMFAWLLSFGTLGINTDDFTGPTIIAISLSSYVLPLLIFEFVRRSQNSVMTYLSCAILIAVGLVFLLGLFGITLSRWYPAITAA